MVSTRALHRVTLTLSTLALGALAACSDGSRPTSLTEPLADLSAAQAKGGSGGGGVGDPHFADDATHCTFSTETGRLACDWRMSGLSSNASGAGFLAGNVAMTYDCSYSNSTKDYTAQTVRFNLQFYYYADKSGTATGHVEDTPNANPTCALKYYSGSFHTGTPSNVAFALDEMSSPFAFPILTAKGTWALYADVKTPKGGIRYVFYLGTWTPEVIS